MFKRVCSFFAVSIITLSGFAAPSDINCDKTTFFEKNLDELETVTSKVESCPKPTSDQFITVCLSIDGKKDPKDGDKFGYKYQEDLWEMSCANAGKDSPEVAKQKIQIMWNTYRAEFKCKGNTENSINGGNVTKFAMDEGLGIFVIHAIKKYNLDMNFIDPYDGKTILDFVEEKLVKLPKADDRYPEYQRVLELLLANGAKRAGDLK
jgi:hypothetical protein